jgi:3-oxoacyl-(acyl-carrier-protein) synthase
MSIHIAGMGWVTPLGAGVDEVWQALLAGAEAKPERVSDAVSSDSYPAFRVPKEALKSAPAHPRLRRASAISRFAAAAGMTALDEARKRLGEIDPARIALVFAIANGGVIYTKRFYHDIVATGAGAASPLLFPETVFNAPSSHLAAIIGVTGPSYTLVGDGAVGLSAVDMANDLLNDPQLECVVVVGAEEVDWLLCDAYARWRLVRSRGPIEPFTKPPRGMIPSEGAGAIVVARKGPLRITRTHPGGYYKSRADLPAAATQMLREVATSSVKLLVGGANGTFIDAAEAQAACEVIPEAAVYTLKPALGESVGASGLWQVIAAAKVFSEKQIPPVLHSPSRFSSKTTTVVSSDTAVVLTCGLNQQLSALALSNA